MKVLKYLKHGFHDWLFDYQESTFPKKGRRSKISNCINHLLLIDTLSQALKLSNKRNLKISSIYHQVAEWLLTHDPLIFQSFMKDLIMAIVVLRVSSRKVTLYLWRVTRTPRVTPSIFVVHLVKKNRVVYKQEINSMNIFTITNSLSLSTQY